MKTICLLFCMGFASYGATSSFRSLQKELTDLNHRFKELSHVLEGERRTCNVLPAVCQGRLSLVSGYYYSEAGQTNNIYFSPYMGNYISLYDGTCWNLMQFSEITFAGASLTATKFYDIFAYNNSGTVDLEFLQWTNATTRVALGKQDGVYVKGSDSTRRYIGTVYTNSGSPTTFYMNASWQYLTNYCNPKCVRSYRSQTAGAWTDSSSSWVAAKVASSYNTFIMNLSGIFFFFRYLNIASTSAAPYATASGLGPVAGTNSAQIYGGKTNTTNTTQIATSWAGMSTTSSNYVAVMQEITDGNTISFNNTSGTTLTGATGFICGR